MAPIFRASLTVALLAWAASCSPNLHQTAFSIAKTPTPPPSFPKFSEPFKPKEFESYQHIARCNAIISSAAPESNSSVTELQLQYTHIVNPNASRTLLFVHGWPGLWSTWSNQILHFSSSYSLVIPNLRGFGASTHPGDVQASGAIHDMTADLACILRDAQVGTVTCIGHDWGAQICWEMARARPDIVEAVAGAVVPYLPSAGPFTPTEALVALLPHLSYQVYFAKETHAAINELNASIRRSLRSVMRSIASPPPSDFLLSLDTFLSSWRHTSYIPAVPFMTAEEEDYLVEQFDKQGFDYTLQFYTNPNRLSYYNYVQSQGNFTIPQPALHIAPTGDPVADWVKAAKLLHASAFIPRLTTATIYAAHWPQLERPDEFNAILDGWLDDIFTPKSTVAAPGTQTGTARTSGEL
ncbi:Alpha/Beta hydrolase protein [Hysterangium stoloniferum]|nr:Alpha/Beta hydrolase protein [Hysterangium stoloniferum]